MSKMKPTITLVVLSALFCLSHSQDPTEYIDVTSSMSSFQAQYKYPPKVVTIRNQIYTVYIKTHISSFLHERFELLLTSLDSVNRRQQVKSCDLSLPSDSLTTTEIDKVVALGNGKIVIATNRQGRHGKEWVYYIIIDPFDCSTERTVKFPYTIDSQTLMALVPYYDSYDIFYRYYTANSTGLPNNPYRYSDEGQRVELDYHLETQPNYYYRFQINTIKPHDASEGYYHTYFDKRTKEIVLQRLDSRFQKVKEVRVKNTDFDTATDESTTQGHISYCSLKIEKPFCKLLNADLEVQFTSQLPKLNFPTAGHVDQREVINLPNKGLVVFISFEHPSDSRTHWRYPYDFYLQWVGSDGSEVKTRKIGSASLEHKDDYKIVNASSKDFCHVTMNRHFGNGEFEVTVYNRCLDL